MKLRVESGALVKAAKWVERAVASRPPTPVLAGMRLTAEQDGLTLAAFDYEVSLTETIPCDVVTPGGVLVPGRLFAQLIGSLPTGTVEFTTDEEGPLEVSCGSVSLSLPRIPLSDYPKLPSPGEPVGSVDSALLASAVAQTQYAVASLNEVPEYTGMYLEVSGGVLNLVACDRHRMPVTEIRWEPHGEEASEFGVIVPRRFMTGAAAVLSGDITVTLSDPTGATGVIGLEAAGRRATSLLIAETYPTWRKFVEKVARPKTRVRLVAAELIAALQRTELILDDLKPAGITVESERVVVHARNRSNAVRAAIDATVDGEPLEAWYRPRFLVEALKAAGTAEVELRLVAPLKPSLLVPVGDDGRHQQVLMPSRPS